MYFKLDKRIDDNIVVTSKKKYFKGVIKDNKANLLKRRYKPKASTINGAILRKTFLFLLPEVKHFIKERKGNQPRLRK